VFVTAFRRRRGAQTDDAFPWTVPRLAQPARKASTWTRRSPAAAAFEVQVRGNPRPARAEQPLPARRDEEGLSQFVIATHSPILAAFPGALIRVFDGDRIVETPYEDLEHVRITRDFLNSPARYLRYLTRSPEETE
jgi:hypothetical protein